MSLQIRSFRCNRVGALAAVASSARPRASAQQLPARSYRRRLYPEHRADRVLGHARRCSTGPIVVAWGGASCASRATTRPRSRMPVT
jgi:hypothetical protein